MEKIRFVGLDVHARSITIAVADRDGGPARMVATIPNELGVLLKHLQRLSASGAIRCCYEAGPLGFALCRELRAKGISCVVIAPSLIPKTPGDHVKTDKRDAENLARFFRSGDLTEVHLPDAVTESMKDLERARFDAKNAQTAARQQLTHFLLRHGKRYDGVKRWSPTHLEWIRYLKFEHEAHNRVLVDYLQAVEQATARIERLMKDIAELVQTWTLRPVVEALQALRGVQLLTAVTVVAEIADFARFETAPKLMAYLGLVPSEHSSGESRRRGGITRCGNANVRTLLVESAWNNRFRPKISRELKKRQEGLDPQTCDVAWKAQHRLHARYTRLSGRGKNAQKTITAMARELTGFIWAIARQPQLLAPA